jgi:hypothetical protein
MILFFRTPGIYRVAGIDNFELDFGKFGKKNKFSTIVNRRKKVINFT